MTRRLSVEVRRLARARVVAVVATEMRRGTHTAWGRRAPILVLVAQGAARRAFTPDGTEITGEVAERLPEAARALRAHGEPP